MYKPAGFALIELMVVVAIVAIPAAVAIPQYQNHVSRTRAAAAVAELQAFRLAVTECIAQRDGAGAAGCSSGTNGISNLTPTTRNVVAWGYVTDGVISATTGATASSGGTPLTYLGTPGIGSGNVITWVNSGTSCDAVRGLKPGQGGCP